MKISKLVFMVTILEAMLWFQPNIRLNAQGAALSLLPEQTKLLEQFDRTAAQVYQAPFTKTDLLSNPSSLLGYPQFSIGLFPILMTQFNELQCHELRFNSELKEKFALVVSHNTNYEQMASTDNIFDPRGCPSIPSSDDVDESNNDDFSISTEIHENMQTSGSIPVFDNNSNFNLIASVILSITYILIKNGSLDVIINENENNNNTQIKKINTQNFCLEEEEEDEEELEEDHVLFNNTNANNNNNNNNEFKRINSNTETMTPPPLKMMKCQQEHMVTPTIASPAISSPESNTITTTTFTTPALPAVVSVSVTPSPKAEKVKRRRYHRKNASSSTSGSIASSSSSSSSRMAKSGAVPSTLPMGLQACFAAECAEYSSTPAEVVTVSDVSNSGGNSPLFATQTFSDALNVQMLNNVNINGRIGVNINGNDIVSANVSDTGSMLGSDNDEYYGNGFGMPLDSSNDGYFGVESDGYCVGGSGEIQEQFVGFENGDVVGDEWVPHFDDGVSPYSY